MNDHIEMPSTVAAYLGDPAVRTAVDALLEVGADTLPPGLEWEEFGTYYLARGGAELTRHDLGHLLRELWGRIWGPLIGPHWQQAPVEEMISEGYAVTPAQIWSEKSFTVYHYQKPYVLYTDVKLEPRALSIAFSVEDDDAGEVLIVDDFSPFRWRDDEDWSGWQVTGVECEPRGTLPSLRSLLAAAASAYFAAEQAVAAQGASR